MTLVTDGASRGREGPGKALTHPDIVPAGPAGSVLVGDARATAGRSAPVTRGRPDCQPPIIAALRALASVEAAATTGIDGCTRPIPDGPSEEHA
jgi:hypothetical protein